MKADWTPTDEGMPPEGVVVDAIGPDGDLLRLRWEGRLWRFAGGSPFPFFTPTYWRRADGTGAPPAGGPEVAPPRTG